MKILIIEDSKTEAKILTQCLKRMYEEPVTVNQESLLSDAVDLLSSEELDYDLVFLDLRLPDSHSWEETYKAIEPYTCKVPVIVLTADNDKDIARELLKNGAEDFIVKGSRKRNFEMLRESIDFALYRHELVRLLSCRAEKDRQAARWMSGAYSVQEPA